MHVTCKGLIQEFNCTLLFILTAIAPSQFQLLCICCRLNALLLLFDFQFMLLCAVLFLCQVGLWKSHTKHKPDSGCFISHHSLATQKITSTNTSPKNLQSFLHEMDLIRNSRDVQVEEAMLFNQKLEQELSRSRDAVALLEDCNRKLKREQLEMRKKVEEARQAVISGLAKVKDLEAKARHVPVLQQHIQQLEIELLYYR